MKTVLEIDPAEYSALMAHLLPAGGEQEQAAFLFADVARADGEIRFNVAETRVLGSADFTSQEGDYLEMADATRAGLIKRAHDLEASLVEIHSHLGPWPAGFSYADRLGLQETVPHMWWRLQKRPYMAIVVAGSGFDALVWLDNPKVPRRLDALIAGGSVLTPTNFSLGGWGERAV